MYLKNLIDVYDSEGRKVNTDALGLLGLKLQIPSPSYNTTSQDIDGRAGVIILDRTLKPRSLTASFLTISHSYKDSLLIRDVLYGLMGNGKRFYVGETEVPGKRWKVYLDDWTPERQTTKVQTFEVPLVCDGGFSETVNTIFKEFTTTTFMFKNEGSLTVDPRIHSETQIEFVGVSTNLKIKNNTTDEEWSWTGTTDSDDVILLSGVKSLKNGTSIFASTNKKLLTMIPGWNSFELTGTSGSIKTTVRTRFYFL